MLIIIVIITILYLLCIGSFTYGFDKVSFFKLEDIAPKTTFSVIIPFRNEAQNLPTLLHSISELNYSKSQYEIILVNDESSDNSIEQINNSLAHLKHVDILVINTVRTTNSPKKDAITLAVSKAKYDWIITTDADCIVPKYWLDSFDNYIQHNASNMLVAPVTFNRANSFFERFQLLDFLSLQGATIGGFGINKPFLCNGANLAYQKDVFLKLKGFDGNSNIASGDDIFLLEKAVKHPGVKVHYVKSDKVIVTTKPLTNFKSLKAQRVRWAAKTSNYNNLFGKITGIIVLLMNLLLLCLPLLFALQIIALKPLVYIVVIKFSIDFLLLFKASRFFNQETYLSSYLFSSLLYPIFNVYVAFVSVFKGYTWKGRAYIK